jgi:hypothetical protein
MDLSRGNVLRYHVHSVWVILSKTAISPDDPPIFMSYGMSPSDKLPSDPGRVRGWIIHHVILGVALKDKADSLNVEAHLQYPGAKPKYESLVEFFQDKLLEE